MVDTKCIHKIQKFTTTINFMYPYARDWKTAEPFRKMSSKIFE